MEEYVFAVPRDRLLPPGEPLRDGVSRGDPRMWLERIERWGEFVPRGEAEVDVAWKQIIPYGVVVSTGDVFLLRRSAQGAETRLHDKRSIGVGGHVERSDRSESIPLPVDDLLLRAFERELHEELAIDPPLSIEWAGVVNDDATPVGRVHFGWLYRVEARGRDVAVREVDRLAGSFVPASALIDVWDHLESWSQAAAEAVLGLTPPGTECRE